MKNIAYHNVSSIELSSIPCYQNSGTGQDFYSRDLVITMTDGSKERIGLYSDNGYHLLVDDKEIDSL